MTACAGSLDDLITLARLEGDPGMKNETIDADVLCRRMLEDARALSQGRHEIAQVMDSHVRLIGNEQELYSAFGNLVSNAVRYTQQGGRITLRWALGAHGGPEFSVIDTGEGIEAQHIPRLTLNPVLDIFEDMNALSYALARKGFTQF